MKNFVSRYSHISTTESNVRIFFSLFFFSETHDKRCYLSRMSNTYLSCSNRKEKKEKKIIFPFYRTFFSREGSTITNNILLSGFEWLFKHFSGQPSNPRGNINFLLRFKRENIDIRGGFFSSNAPRSPTCPLLPVPSTQTGTATGNTVTSAHRRKLERNRSAGVPRQDVVNTESTFKLEPKTITGPIVFH